MVRREEKIEITRPSIEEALIDAGSFVAHREHKGEAWCVCSWRANPKWIIFTGSYTVTCAKLYEVKKNGN